MMTEVPILIDGRCGDDVCSRESYIVSVRCGNCGLEGELQCTKGHEAWRTANWEKCPRCECKNLNAGDYLREGKEGEGDGD